jgi:hypothetical protein
VIEITDPAIVGRWVERDSGQWADFSGFFADPRNICLAEGDGGAFFLWREPGTYEVHVAFEQRGRAVIDLSHRMLAHMREKHGATRFIGPVPKHDRKVQLFTRLMGWRSIGDHGEYEIFIGS